MWGPGAAGYLHPHPVGTRGLGWRTWPSLGVCFGNNYPPLSVLNPPSPQEVVQHCGFTVGQTGSCTVRGVMGYQPQNSPLVLALGEGSRSWHQHSCWGVTGSCLGKLCRNTTWAACPALCPFPPRPRPSSEAVQTLRRHACRLGLSTQHARQVFANDD